jgi:hypothetical protein
MMLNIPIVKMKVEKEVIRIFLNRNPKWRTDNIKIGKEFFKILLKVLKVFLAGVGSYIFRRDKIMEYMQEILKSEDEGKNLE